MLASSESPRTSSVTRRAYRARCSAACSILSSIVLCRANPEAGSQLRFVIIDQFEKFGQPINGRFLLPRQERQEYVDRCVEVSVVDGEFWVRWGDVDRQQPLQLHDGELIQVIEIVRA